MIRKLALGLILPCLTACGQASGPIRSARPPADVPDAALVAACDTSERDPRLNIDLAEELISTRHQRDDCAAQVEGLRHWRKDAARRANEF